MNESRLVEIWEVGSSKKKSKPRGQRSPNLSLVVL